MALVMITIFAIGALVLTGTLLKLSALGVTDSAERHGRKTLNAVLQAGISASIYEINHDQVAGPYDPDGDGVGALGCAGTAAGIQVSVAGRNLGRYRTSIEKDGSGRMILTAVAAYPDFTNPRRTAAAQVLVKLGKPPFLADRNALSVVGPAPSSPEISIQGGAHFKVVDTGNLVPAVNISDPSTVSNPGFYGAFLSQVVTDPHVQISGADPNNPGSGVSGAGSVTNNPAGLLSSASVTAMAQNVRDFVNAQTPTDFSTAVTANGGSVSGDTVSGNATLPNGIYKIGSQTSLSNATTITGTGSLIIETSSLKLPNGSRLNWNGDVIVIGNGTKIEAQHGGRLDVGGTLAMVSLAGADVKLEAQGGSRINVDGAFLTLAGSSSKVDVQNQSGSRLNVNGIYATLGSKLDWQIQHGARINVDGSMVVAYPSDVSDPKFKMEFQSGAHVHFTFDNPNFETALTSLGNFFSGTGSNSVFPASSAGYWEQGGAGGLLAAQQTRITNGDPLGWNNQ